MSQSRISRYDPVAVSSLCILFDNFGLKVFQTFQWPWITLFTNLGFSTAGEQTFLVNLTLVLGFMAISLEILDSSKFFNFFATFYEVFTK